MDSRIKLAIFIIFLAGGFFLLDYFDIHEVISNPKVIVDTAEKGKKAGAGIIVNENTETKSIDEKFQGTAEDVVALANKARIAEGLRELTINELLSKSAQAKAQDMKDKSYFEHISPEGLQPWFFVEEAGYKYKTVGENLAEGYFSATSVHEAWMDSEGHRENIVSDKFEEIGVGILEIKRNGQQSFLIVQHFGSQLKPEDLEPVTVCDKEVKKNCEDAEEKEAEVEDAIKEQKKIIKEAKKHNANSEDIEAAEDNLDKLKEVEDEIEEYLDKCEEYFDNCDKWR